MASGPIVGEGDGPTEKVKVYTRKPKKNKTLNTATTTAPTSAALAAAPSAITTTANNKNSIKGNEKKKNNITEKNDNNITEKNDNNTENNYNNITEKNDSNTREKETDSSTKENDNSAKENDGSAKEKETENNINENDSNTREEETENNIKEKETENNKNDSQNNNNNDENLTRPPEVQTIQSEDGNSAQQQQPVLQQGAAAAAASGDSSSLNRQEVVEAVVEPESQEAPAENGVAKEGQESRVKINLGSRSKQEMRELRRKLESELDMVRGLVKKIETKQGQIGGFVHSHVSLNDGVNSTGGGLRRVHSEVASAGVSHEATRPLHQLSISVLENSQGMSDIVEKEKRTPKVNQFYQSSEFLLAKDKFPPAESNKKLKVNGKKHHGGGDLGLGYGMGSKFFKSCSSSLEKLMKHKHGWVFNEPVDAAKLELHDYHIIIRNPMDLGTIKSRLNKNWYKSPKEFAEDVRLTFRNAMTYNPPGQDVHVMAEVLSKMFEERWAIIESDYNREMRLGFDYGATLPTPTSRKAPPLPPPPLDMRRILDRSESISHHVDPKPKPMTITPRTPAPKKPKAKDPHKREMTFEEKQKLSTNLQSLPSEKLDAIVQIIKRRNSSLCQNDDEIEVDIDSVDVETLWELDRFVTNFKKSLSKHKRKAEMAMQARAEAEQNVQQQTHISIVAEVPKETKTDENIVSSSVPIRGNNQGDNRSRSSSSSSSSSDSGSSSSDSDSDSSSASGSDAGSPRS